MTETRVFFRDIKPYEVPDSLDDLRGPRHGTVELRRSIYWAPGSGGVDLDAPGGIATAYESVLSEGVVADQVVILNRVRLIEVWPRLMLPDRVRALWESMFPELAHRSVA